MPAYVDGRMLAITEAALREFLKDKLSPVEMPRLIELRDALPRTPVGKISRRDLREEEQNRRGDAPATAATSSAWPRATRC